MSTNVDAWDVVKSASECGDHPCDVPFAEDDIDRVLHYFNEDGSWAEQNCLAVFQLKDGRYVRAWANADTSGHG